MSRFWLYSVVGVCEQDWENRIPNNVLGKNHLHFSYVCKVCVQITWSTVCEKNAVKQIPVLLLLTDIGKRNMEPVVLGNIGSHSVSETCRCLCPMWKSKFAVGEPCVMQMKPLLNIDNYFHSICAWQNGVLHFLLVFTSLLVFDSSVLHNGNSAAGTIAVTLQLSDFCTFSNIKGKIHYVALWFHDIWIENKQFTYFCDIGQFSKWHFYI